MTNTFIATVFNEEDTIEDLLDSLLRQTKMPDEIVFVDGKSADTTYKILMSYVEKFKEKSIKFSAVIKRGNRAVGRNEAIKHSKGNIILCSDAGCILDKNWVKYITEPFANPKVDVVAGYYKGKATDVFQKSLIPYVLVMPDKVDPNTFLPATRSIAFKKLAWRKAGGFTEQFSNNEDYVFAKRLKAIEANIYFKKDALCEWIPRKNLRQAFIMFFRFAMGDAESNILRPKVVLIFIRYLLASLIAFLFFIFKLYFILYALYFILLMYFVWAIIKNYKYVLDYRAIFILPILQIVSDIAVLTGTLFGLFKVWDIKKMQ